MNRPAESRIRKCRLPPDSRPEIGTRNCGVYPVSPPDIEVQRLHVVQCRIPPVPWPDIILLAYERAGYHRINAGYHRFHHAYKTTPDPLQIQVILPAYEHAGYVTIYIIFIHFWVPSISPNEIAGYHRIVGRHRILSNSGHPASL
jgi:hypothetical protein